jgi:DNA-binding response OmpR family regulator
VKARTAFTLVVADDKSELRKLIRITFAGDDCRIVEADNGEDAIRLIQSEKPLIALIDIMMPGIDGLEVCRRVRADAAVATTRLILVTARGQQTDVMEGIKAGADDYIIKPFSPESLRQRVLANLGPPCA